ncbi:transposase [Ruminococcus difficilis]|uniref:Transposase n=1 Tax=Ruminococcus difficilis TaxID=2763069 RepID=A0A934TZD7_9FIRM|nr:transposase [Ruminococcus difficilis]MBK6088275.1 transposase [Ruminococcus difficilis]
MTDLYSFDDFYDLFFDEKHCLDYLYALRWSNGFCCPRCGCNDSWEISPYKNKCRNCEYQCTVTAGTLFHHTHLPLTKWFRAAWYLTNINSKATAEEIKELIDIGLRAAKSVNKKLKSAMVCDDFNTRKLKGLVEISGKRKPTDQEKRKYRYARNDKNVDFEDFVYLAVEIVNKKVQRIKMSVYPYDNKESFTDFVCNSVEENSTLQLSFPIKRIRIEIDHLDKRIKKMGISLMRKPDTYNYQFVEKTFDDFMDFYKANSYRPESINEAVNEYTKRINGFNPEISFEDLMQNAINNNTIDFRRLPIIK